MGLSEKHKEEWLLIRKQVRDFKRKNPEVSQRKIAARYEISLGVVNKYLKNLQM